MNTKYFVGLALLVTYMSLAWAGDSSPPALFALAEPNASVASAATGRREPALEKPSRDAISIDLNSEQGLLEMRFKNGKLLTYAFAARQFKPYVRELFSLSGENILRDAPADHLHHHGLMYAIRVNGVNFWEETGQPGHERSVKFLSHEAGTSPAGLPQARFSQLIHWIKDRDKALAETRSVALLVEQRTITVTVDEAQQEVALEWRGDFTVGPGASKVSLTGSEYNGLGLRLPQTFDHAARHENSGRLPYAGPGQRDVIAANWSSVTGSAGGRDMTIALLARPTETRGTTKFFTMLDPFAYLAVTQGLDKAPLDYSGRDTFSVRYLLVVYSTSRTPEFVQQRLQRWGRQTDDPNPTHR